MRTTNEVPKYCRSCGEMLLEEERTLAYHAITGNKLKTLICPRNPTQIGHDRWYESGIGWGWELN